MERCRSDLERWRKQHPCLYTYVRWIHLTKSKYVYLNHVRLNIFFFYLEFAQLIEFNWSILYMLYNDESEYLIRLNLGKITQIEKLIFKYSNMIIILINAKFREYLKHLTLFWSRMSITMFLGYVTWFGSTWFILST